MGISSKLIMCFTQRQLFEHFVSDGRIGDVDDERHARFPVASDHCSILPSGRGRQFPDFSGRTANTCDCSKPGLMVLMARIWSSASFHSGSLCVCGIEADKAATAPMRRQSNFMLSPLCVAQATGEPVGEHRLQGSRIATIMWRERGPS